VPGAGELAGLPGAAHPAGLVDHDDVGPGVDGGPAAVLGVGVHERDAGEAGLG